MSNYTENYQIQVTLIIKNKLKNELSYQRSPFICTIEDLENDLVLNKQKPQQIYFAPGKVNAYDELPRIHENTEVNKYLIIAINNK